jgi:hypothetical protein
MDTFFTAAALLAVAAALLVAQFRVLLVAVDRLLAGDREATDEALRQLQAVPRLEVRLERLERRIAAMAMPAPPPSPPPPLREHTLGSKDVAQQSLPVEAPAAQDVASAVDSPYIGGFRGRTSKEPRPHRLHRVCRSASFGSLADDEPGAATGAEARPVVRHSSEQFKDGPGAQPQMKRYSASTRDSLPPPEPNASFRKDCRDRNDRASLPLSPLPAPISSCASPRALRTPLPAGERRVSSSKSKSGKPLSSGALFYARVVERMFEEEHPERRVSGPAGRRLTMAEVHESIIGSPASSRSDVRTTRSCQERFPIRGFGDGWSRFSEQEHA